MPILCLIWRKSGEGGVRYFAEVFEILYTVVPYYDSNIFFSHKIRMYGNLCIENEIQWKKKFFKFLNQGIEYNFHI